MPSTEAQRTLVKSPPELWTELSDPVSLARHLGDVGEIRIARVEPDTKVEWETESASGTVELKPSGWGTKVTLTIARAAPLPVLPEPEPQPQPIQEAPLEPEPQARVTLESEPQVQDTLESEPQVQDTLEPEPQARVTLESEPQVQDTLESEPQAQDTPERRRWWARLFRRRRTPSQTPAPAPEFAPAPPIEAEESPDLAAELAAELVRLEETLAAQDAELLGAVLDRLGAAHHRPFSRG